jgi:alpha-L-arabinofuranosidase
MKKRSRTALRHLTVLVPFFLWGCSDGLFSPAPPGPGPTPAEDGMTLDRMQDDFQEEIRWTGIDAASAGWTTVTRTDRPDGDQLVFTHTDPASQPRIALWDEPVLSGNGKAGFEVLARTDAAHWMGVVFNYQPDGSYYLFRVQPETSLWDLQQIGPAGSSSIAGGKAEDQGNLIRTDEYIRLRLGWSPFVPDLLQAGIVSPTTGVHELAAVSLSRPLRGGRAGLYCDASGVWFDDAGVTGTLRMTSKPRITVHADRAPQGDFSRRVLGANFVWRGDVNGIDNTIYDERLYQAAIAKWFTLLNKAGPAGVSSTRYPGGLESSFFYWKHGVGPASSRCNPGNLSHEDTISVGTDEFLQFTEELGAEAVITLNPQHFSLPLGSPAVAQYAADWVEYCNAPNNGSNPGGGVDFAALRAFHGHNAPYGVPYWEIGNEIAGLTTTQLAGIIRSVSGATRRIDPDIQLGFQDHVFTPPYNQAPFAPSARDYYTNPQGTGILDLAGNDFSFWEPHPYGPALVEIGPAFFQNGATITVPHTFYTPGTYLLTLTGFCSNPTPEPVRSHRYGTLTVRLDEEPVWSFEVASVSERSWSQEILVPAAGTYTLTIEGDNLIQDRVIYVTNELAVKDQATGDTQKVDLTNSTEVYGIEQATAPTVDYVFFGLFSDYYGGKAVYPTEWNTTMGFYDAPNDLKWALSNAEYLNVFFRNNVGVSSFWDLTSASLLVGLIEGVPQRFPDPRLRPTAYVFQLYRDLLTGSRLDVSSDGSPFYLRGIDGLRLGVVGDLVNLRIPYLSAIAGISPAGDVLSLIVLNRHPSLPLQADLALDGFSPSGKGIVSVINAPSIATNNERDTCPSPGNCVATAVSGLSGASSDFSYVFPAHSITAFTFFRPGASSQPPLPPSNLTAAVEDQSIRLQWSASASGGVSGTNLYRSRWADGPYGDRINPAPVTSLQYTDANLDPSVTYYYAARAVDADGRESANSGKAAARIPGRAPATYLPQGLEILAGVPNGSIRALDLGDDWMQQPLDGDTFYRVGSVLGSTDWFLNFLISEDPASVSAMALYFQAIYSRDGIQHFLLYNHSRGVWDAVRTQEVDSGLIARYMEAFTDPEFVREHISDTGEIHLRVTAPLGGSFTCYADYGAVSVK